MAQIKTMLFKPTFEAINRLLALKDFPTSGLDAVPSKNNVALEENTFKIKFNSAYTDSISKYWMVNLPEYSIRDNEGIEYVIEEGSSCFVGNLIMSRLQKQDFVIHVSRLRQSTIDIEKKYYWRFVYPIDHEDWLFRINATPFKDDFGTTHTMSMLEMEFGGQTLFLTARSLGDQHFMVIDSTSELDAIVMEGICNTILTVLGIVTGKRYGNYRFSLCSDEPTFSKIIGLSYQKLQKSKTCPYRIFDTSRTVVLESLSRFDYQQYAKEMIAKNDTDVIWYYNDDSITKEAFNKLLALCNSDNDMIIAASMLLDGTMLNIEYQKSFFSVVLEAVTSSLLKDDMIKPQPPMSWDSFNKEVRPAIETLIDSFDCISDEGKSIMKKKLTGINQGPNANKLTLAFERLGYKLSDRDRAAIDGRNFVFHGHLASSKEELHQQQEQLFSESLRLHKLCCVLLFLKAGFKGRLLNNEVLFGIKEACEQKESPYIEF